jgi:hypothetical protein
LNDALERNVSGGGVFFVGDGPSSPDFHAWEMLDQVIQALHLRWLFLTREFSVQSPRLVLRHRQPFAPAPIPRRLPQKVSRKHIISIKTTTFLSSLVECK